MPASSQSSAAAPTPPRSAAGVTLVVPAYDEEGGIEGVVERLAALDLGVPFELLVVNDGSQDATAQRLEELSARFPVLRVIEHPINRGYGAALKTGFAAAKHDVVVITDADGTYPEDRIKDLLERIDLGAEMAIGARIGANVHIPLIRRPAKNALRLLASYLAGRKIPDLNSGLRAFRRELVLKYVPVLPDGFSFTTTITLASITNGHRVDYIKIDYAPRSGRSKIRPIRDTLGFTALIIRTIVYFNPLKVFYPAALSLLALFVVSLSYDLFFVEGAPDMGDKTVLLFVAFVQVMSLGLIADLIDRKSRMGS